MSEEIIKEVENEIGVRLRCFMSLCESPIEKLFAANFLRFHVNLYSFGEYNINFEFDHCYEVVNGQEINPSLDRLPPNTGRIMYQPGMYVSGVRFLGGSGAVRADSPLRNIEEICLRPQEIIMVEGKRYRVDFLLMYRLFSDPPFNANRPDAYFPYKFIIECDGHEWHEKTSEQATKDRKRARELLTLGYTVFPYSGSELYHNRGYEQFKTIVLQIHDAINNRRKSNN